MKTGKTLTQLAVELDRQQSAKRDFVADSRKLSLSDDGQLLIDGQGALSMTSHCSNQVATHCDIPKKYWDKMPAELRATNANHWLHKDPAKRMIRTLDGSARAFLSDRYRALDNYDLAEAVLPVLQETPDMQIVSSELTDKRMYIKALFPRIQGEVAKGDIVQSGVVISNSEIGSGSLRVEPLVFRLVCLNGMISNMATRKYHVGKASGIGESAMEIFRPETMAMTDKAFWMQVQDTVRASVNQLGFDAIVAEMQRTKGMVMQIDPIEVVERVQKHFTLQESEKRGVLQHLLTGGDLTAYGLLNALTRHSQDIEDYDRATDFERMGGQIIELPQSQWKALAIAA